MEEIKELRSYIAATYRKNADENVYRLFATPIHYANKLGLGDGIGGMRQSDYTLLPMAGGWGFEFNNFLPLLPQFADEVQDFRDIFYDKDQTVGLRPMCAHVEGALVGNSVEYLDAFGAGIDMICYPIATGIRKVIRVREAAKDNKDMHFDFEILAPVSKDIFIGETKKGQIKDAEKWDKKASKATEKKSILIGKDDATREPFTHIKPLRMWDSGKIVAPLTGQIVLPVPFTVREEGGKLILRKTLPKDFLKDSVGDVFTDAVTTIQEDKDTYYGTSFTTGGAPNSTTLNIGGWGDFYYSYIEFDLTGSPSAADATSAMLSLRVNSVAVNNSTTFIRRITASWTEAGVTSGANPASVTTDEVALVNPVTVGAGNRDNKDIIIFYDGWKAGTFSNFGVKLHSTTNNNAAHTYSSSDDATPANRPYLDVTYTAGTYDSTAKAVRAFAGD